MFLVPLGSGYFLSGSLLFCPVILHAYGQSRPNFSPKDARVHLHRDTGTPPVSSFPMPCRSPSSRVSEQIPEVSVPFYQPKNREYSRILRRLSYTLDATEAR